MANLEKLREIGAQRIYEQTHIARRFVEDILNEKYSSMNKIQFAGFVSILEREYGVDLHELIETYNTQFSKNDAKPAEPFVVSIQESGSKEKNKMLYIAVPLLLLGAVFFVYTLNSGPKEMTEPTTPFDEVHEVTVNIDSEFNNTMIEEAKVNLDQIGNTTTSVEMLSEEKMEDAEMTIEPVHSSKFEIIPRSKLWIGMIDLETFARSQKLTSDSFELDSDKDWLLVMGHGYVEFNINGEEMKFSDEDKVWFSYENGILTKLSRKEFKEKNRGKAW